jgi:hypothetical protein
MFGRKHKKLAIAITCADWRLHQHRVDLNRRLARSLKVDGVDLLAVPGPDGLLRPERNGEWQALVAQASLLIGAHSPETVAVVAHQRCAGHPVSDHDHDTDVAAAAKALKQATGFAGPVVAMVAVYNSDTSWDLKTVS